MRSFGFNRTSPEDRPREAGVTHVELRGVSKSFGATKALRNVSLRVQRGTVHALVGENGAGKSTLGKTIAGVHRPDHGELLVDGEVVHFGSPRQALRHGMTIIAQELALVPRRSVIENVFLGNEPVRVSSIDRAGLRRRYAELEDLAGFGLEPNAIVGDLRVAECQKVEILRALARESRLIVMDEPTAALAGPEAAALLEVIDRLRGQGKTIVYVSHMLEEVLSISDELSVLKDGSLVRSTVPERETVDSLVESMIGRSLDLTFPERVPPPTDAPVVLSVRGLGRGNAVTDAALDLRAGEIVGIAGLVGSGRSELARLIFGADRRDSGEMLIAGEAFGPRSPRSAIDQGVAMLPESRKDQGLLMNCSVAENISLASIDKVCNAGILRRREERAEVRGLIRDLSIRCSGVDASVASLSGGNQQKVLFAKWLFARPKVFVIDEPTRGVDIGAKQSIYKVIRSLAERGTGVIVISSEVEEVLGLAHRVLVMRAGRIVHETLEVEGSTDEVMRAAFGTLGSEGRS